MNFLRTAYQAVKGEQVGALAFRKHMKEQMDRLGVDDAMVNRYVNQGSPGARRSGTRCSSSRCCNRRSRSWTRPTRLEGCGRSWSGPAWGAPDHPLPTHAELHHARHGPRDDARAYREDWRGGAGARARGQGLRGHPPSWGRGRGDRSEPHDDHDRTRRDRDRDRPVGSTSTRSGATSRSSRGPWGASARLPRQRRDFAKPTQVIEAEADFEAAQRDAHRGIHMLGEEATQAYEGARATWPGSSAHPSPRRSCSREA